MCGQHWGKAVGTGCGGRRKLFLREEIAHYAAGQFDAKLKDSLRALCVKLGVGKVEGLAYCAP
jgi:hypothetical protein